MQYSDWSHSDSLFCPLLALQPQQQRAILSSFMIVASLMMCSQLAAFFRLMLYEVNSDPQYTHTVSRSRTSTSSSAGIFQLFAMIILHNVKEHATLSAGASVDHGVEVETKENHVNRAADRGCCVSTCSESSHQVRETERLSFLASDSIKLTISERLFSCSSIVRSEL